MISIADFTIGASKSVLVVAELSANHNQKKDIAIETIKAAKRAGADAIKLQTYTPDTLTIDCDNEYFRISGGTPWDGKTLYQLYQEAYTPWEWHEDLFRVAREEGLICFSTPFDKTAVDFLEQFDPPAYKIASFEIQDTQLIEYAAAKGRPMILSTGIAELEDIHLAVKTCRAAGNDQIILLKCTSSYPAPVEEANLLTIPNMRETFGVEVGLSDHTMGIAVPVVAVALGARIIEKHFILDRTIGGPDAAFSLDEKELAEMVRAVHDAERAIGKVSYDLSQKVKANRVFGRSLFAVKNIMAGEPFTKDNVRCIRPGHGLAPKHLGKVLGRRATRDIEHGTPLAWNNMTSTKIIATIEARMASTRLPGKVMLPILGKPMLELQIERVERAMRLDQIVIATTTNSTDDSIEQLAHRLGVSCFRGSEEDVLDRVLRAARSVNADVIVELTGDCPLLDPAVIDELVNIYSAHQFDYVSNILHRTFPRGLDTQVFATAVLEEVARLTQDPADREHVSLYIYQHPERFTLHNVVSGLPEKYWDLRLTVDTLEDFTLVETIYEELYPRNPAFCLQEVLDLLDRRRELIEINREIQQKRV